MRPHSTAVTAPRLAPTAGLLAPDPCTRRAWALHRPPPPNAHRAWALSSQNSRTPYLTPTLDGGEGVEAGTHTGRRDGRRGWHPHSTALNANTRRAWALWAATSHTPTVTDMPETDCAPHPAVPSSPRQVMTTEEAGASPARSRHCDRCATLISHGRKAVRRGRAATREPGDSRHRVLQPGAVDPERVSAITHASAPVHGPRSDQP